MADIVLVKQDPAEIAEADRASDAHELKQGQWFTACALCQDCHTGSFNGWHGQRRMWAIKKMEELDALAVTIKRLYAPRGVGA